VKHVQVQFYVIQLLVFIVTMVRVSVHMVIIGI